MTGKSDAQRIRLIKEFVAANPAEWVALVGPNRSVDEYLDDYRYIEDIVIHVCSDLGITV